MLETLKLGAVHLTGKALYALARISQGDIRAIIVCLSGGGYFENDLNAHIVIDGNGKAYSNVFDLKRARNGSYWQKGNVIVSLLGTTSSTASGPPSPEGEGSNLINEKQLNSLAHVVAILCLGLRLTLEEIKVMFTLWPGQEEPAGEIIRKWTASVLEDMKNGLYPSIDPKKAEEAVEKLFGE